MVVVGAENKLALEALGALDAKRLILVAFNADDASIAAHTAAGGAVVTNMPGKHQKRDRIVLAREQEILVSVPIARAASKSNARHVARRRLQARMFAVALAFGMGVSGTDIKAGLRTKR
jgi:N-acetyl-beta-hexosaminidase